jgi:hypothetical protein
MAKRREDEWEVMIRYEECGAHRKRKEDEG